jgi:hypothetical protein
MVCSSPHWQVAGGISGSWSGGSSNVDFGVDCEDYEDYECFSAVASSEGMQHEALLRKPFG